MRCEHEHEHERARERGVAAVVAVAFALAVVPAVGCASEYTIIDRSSLVISENARISAANVLPGGERNARAVNHLALAQEVYQKQLDLLKDRRNKVRGRRRALNLMSFGALVASSIAVGTVALSGSSPETQRQAGGAAMVGVGLGTGLQIGALMQEESSTVDAKIRYLEGIYGAMVERVRVLSEQQPSEQSSAAIGAAIEGFINEALQINVKG